MYDSVEESSDIARRVRMQGRPLAVEYSHIRSWSRTPQAYAFSSGEVGRLGQLTPERYLDDRSRLKATRLKLLCRLGCLPVMDRVGREAKPSPWPKDQRTCPMCHQGVENVAHFVVECPAYATHRARLHTQVTHALQDCEGHVTVDDYCQMGNAAQSRVLPGQRLGDPVVEDRIDVHVKKYLVKAWNVRSCMTSHINTVMGTAYEVCASAV